MPLSGYIWEENGEIIGNVSLIPYRHDRKKYYLIANVAVRPEDRRRGIGRALTVAAMQHAKQRHSDEIWLHVRDDNPGAIELYRSLGFIEMARRTSWQAPAGQSTDKDDSGVQVTSRAAGDWPDQQNWLRQLYPELLTWYQPMPWLSLRPGLGPMFYRVLSDINVRHWVARNVNKPLAVLTWQAMTGKNDCLWAAVPPQDDQDAEHALTALLIYARRVLAWRQKLVLDFPAGHYSPSIAASGFRAYRTLLWMKNAET